MPGGTPAPARESPVLPVVIEGVPITDVKAWAGNDWPALASDPATLAAYVQAAIESGEITPPNDWDRAVVPGGLAKPRGRYNPPFVNPHGEAAEHRVEHPGRQPLPQAAITPRDHFYDHVMACDRCRPPVDCYCPAGEALREAYWDAVMGG